MSGNEKALYPNYTEVWKAERDLKRANKGKAWAHKADHILQAKKEVLDEDKLAAGMGVATTAPKRRHSILERAQLLAAWGPQCTQGGSLLGSLSRSRTENGGDCIHLRRV